jgi:hypothetical protein
MYNQNENSAGTSQIRRSSRTLSARAAGKLPATTSTTRRPVRKTGTRLQEESNFTESPSPNQTEVSVSRPLPLSLPVVEAAAPRRTIKTDRLKFDGSNLDGFLFKLANEARAQGIQGDEELIALLAVCSFTGQASEWATSQAKQNAMPNTWSELLPRMEQVFYRSGIQQEARTKVGRFIQMKSVPEHNVSFNTLLSEAGYERASAQSVQLYRNSLSLELLRKLDPLPEEDCNLDLVQKRAESKGQWMEHMYSLENDGKKFSWNKGNSPNSQSGIKRKADDPVAPNPPPFKATLLSSSVSSTSLGANYNGNGNRPRRPPGCWACDAKDHFKKDCPRFKKWKEDRVSSDNNKGF